MHEGHRQRMREKFLKNGEDAFLEHEFLEMLLFYAIPRCNTNDLAHALIDKFGSFHGVLDADLHALKGVEGIGDHAASFITMLSACVRVYSKSTQKNVRCFDKLSVARDFGIAMFRGLATEQLGALLLDNRLRMLEFSYLKKGTVNHVPFDLESLYKICVNRPPAAVILYHNHPNGLAVPSQDDMSLTHLIEGKLADLGICLLEHFIVSEHACLPVESAKQDLAMRALAKANVGRRALEDFYCT